MKRIFSYTITQTESNMTIYCYLLKKGFSRQNITTLKKIPESILVNGKWEYVKYKLNEGERLTIHITEEKSSEKIVPIDMPLSIIYEDEDILIVNKSADMPIHPSLNNYENTLANGVAFYYEKQNQPFVFRCMNRLDRDTTGLTIIAKHMVSAGMFSQMMVRREIGREYLAIAYGTGLPREGTINAPIARVDGSTIERCVDYKQGEQAVTHYRVIEEYQNKTLLLLWLETGRTHQIRVHMKHLNHPLLGDFLYFPSDKAIRSDQNIERQALHAYRLTFVHPITGNHMVITAPIPNDMLTLFPYFPKEFK